MKKVRLLSGVMMLIPLPLSMGYLLIGELYHEIIGIAIGLLFITHLIFNKEWFSSLTKERYDARRIVTTAIGFMLILCMLTSTVSGIFLSKHLFRFLGIHSLGTVMRTLHMAAAYWGLILIGFHAGTHGGIVFAKLNKPIKAIIAVVFLIVSAYGVYAFIQRGVADFLIGKSVFVFFDKSAQFILYYLDHLSIIILFMTVGYLTEKLLGIGKRAELKRQRAAISAVMIAFIIMAGFTQSVTAATDPVQADPAPVNIDPYRLYDYEVREIWCDNNGQKIYGEAYIPITDGKSPLVIHSHGMGTNHNAGASYGEKYAQYGVALYCFDFRGGTNLEKRSNRSDGKSTDMSVMTEASDVTAVLNAAKTWDFVDTDRIYLEGGSQGGLVTAIAGVRHEDEIAGMILHYPAFEMVNIMRDGRSIEEIPETIDFDGFVVGRKFIEDLWSYEVRDDIPDFDKPVLIIQGSADDLVRPAVSKQASELYPDCEYKVIEGAGHGFDGSQHDEATRYALDFLYRQFGIERTAAHLTVHCIFLISTFVLSITAAIICALIAKKKRAAATG